MTCRNAIKKVFTYGISGIIVGIGFLFLLLCFEGFTGQVSYPEYEYSVLYPVFEWINKNEMILVSIIVITGFAIGAVIGFFSLFIKKNDTPPT